MYMNQWLVIKRLCLEESFAPGLVTVVVIFWVILSLTLLILNLNQMHGNQALSLFTPHELCVIAKQKAESFSLHIRHMTISQRRNDLEPPLYLLQCLSIGASPHISFLLASFTYISHSFLSFCIAYARQKRTTDRQTHFLG